MVLCRAPLSLFIAPPADNSRRSSMRGRMVCLSDRSFEESQSPKKSQLVVSITGATGFIGRRLVQKLIADDHIVLILTRSRRNAQLVFPDQRFPEIVIAEEEEWSKCIEGSNAVVNLAGMPISTRWSSEVKKEIKQSRIKVTSKVVDLINKLNSSARPSVLISATAIGYYGTSETQVFDETSPSGNDYLAEVCREWETIALEVDKDVRLLLLRIGVVLGRDGGALAKMIPLFKTFAGGPLGSGKQWFSWIHMDDLVSLIYEALRNPSYKGSMLKFYQLKLWSFCQKSFLLSVDASSQAFGHLKTGDFPLETGLGSMKVLYLISTPKEEGSKRTPAFLLQLISFSTRIHTVPFESTFFFYKEGVKRKTTMSKLGFVCIS